MVARLSCITCLALLFGSAPAAQNAASTAPIPIVQPFFDASSQGQVFLVECRNPLGTPIDRFDYRWIRNYRIDGVDRVILGHGFSIGVGPGPGPAPIPKDGLWRGALEMLPPGASTRVGTDADAESALGIVGARTIVQAVEPGRHTIAVQCFDAWSDDLAFSWPPPRSTKVEIGSLIAPLVKLSDVGPRYPPGARAVRVEGTVIVEATIGVDGTVAPVRVIRSIPLLDQAALDAVRQWRFAPVLFDGAPVSLVVTLAVPFTIR